MLTVLPLVAALLGCSGAADGPEQFSVSGTVTLDGEPVAEGSITLESSDDAGGTEGGSISAGKYQVDTTAGPKVVRISAPIVVGERKLYDTPDSPMAKITEESIPAAYNTESTLTATVSADSTSFDFALESGQSAD